MSRPGLFVVLAGPDGSGKSTLAPRLVSLASNSGRPARHMHWRPGVFPQAGAFVGRPQTGDPSQPHGQAAQRTFLSLSRLLYYWLDFLVGGWLQVLPVRRRGGLVVMERGWWDMAVDPRRYNLRPFPRLIRFLGLLLPGPDLLLVLRASPDVLTQRKEELPASELARQNDTWVGIELPGRTVKVFLDATRSQEELVADAVAHMAEVSGGNAVGASGVE